MSALISVVPLLLPMLAFTVTGFLVPFKLASNASASNANRLVPVGLIATSKAAPSISPRKVNGPTPVPLKEPGGRTKMFHVKHFGTIFHNHTSVT
jgi:hypothetical protein